MTLEELVREFDKSKMWCEGQVDNIWHRIDELKESVKELRQGQSWKWVAPIVVILLLQIVIFAVKWGQVTEQLKTLEKVEQRLDRIMGGPD